MSKILITENQLRNVLFKTFLKNPKLLLREQEEDPTEIDSGISSLLADVSQQSITDKHRKELLLMTIRRNWAKSNANILGLDPGAFIFDHLIGSNIPDNIKKKWTYAANAEGKLRSQDALDILQLGTAIMPADAFGYRITNKVTGIDLGTSLISLVSNFLFARHLSNLNAGNQGMHQIIQINVQGQKDIIKQGDLGNEAVWYYVAAACDLLSAATAGWFFVDAKFISKFFRRFTAEGQSKILTTIATDSNGNVVEKVVNTSKADEGINLADDGTKKVDDLEYFNAQSSEVVRNIVNDVNQEATETFATVSKLSPSDDDDPFLKSLNKLEASIEQPPDSQKFEKLDITSEETMVNKNKQVLRKKIEEIREDLKNPASTTVTYDIIVDKEIKENSNVFTVNRTTTDSGKVIEEVKELSEEKLYKFLVTLEEFTGISKDQFFKEINDFLKSNYKFNNSNFEITKDNFVEIYNDIMRQEGAAAVKSSLYKKLQNYSDQIAGKAKLRVVNNVDEVFPAVLKQKYLEKLKKIDEAIRQTLLPEASDVLDIIFKYLKNNPKLSSDEINNLIKNMPSTVDKEKLFILIKGRQNNVKELLNLSLDRKAFELSQTKTKYAEVIDPDYVANAPVPANIPNFYNDFDNYFDLDRQYNAMKKVYDELTDLNFINEYLYRRRLSRYHKGINSNLTSKIDSILNLMDPTNTTSFAKNNENLKKAFEKYKINKVIDGVLGVGSAEQQQQIENIYQWFRYLKRYMDRYEATCDLINDTDAIKEVDYIYNLVDKGIIDYSGASGVGGKTIFELLGFESVEALNRLKKEDHKKLEKLIREKAVNKEFLDTINKGVISNFLEVDRVNVKIPELISTKLVEDMNSAAGTFQLNYQKVVNLVEEIGELDKTLPQMIDMNITIIEELSKRRATLQAQLKSGANVNVELNLIEMQVEFLTGFNDGLRKFVNNARENSGLGTAGLNKLDTKLVPEPGATNEKKFEKINAVIKICQSAEGDRTLSNASYIGAFIQWFNRFFTKFKERRYKNVAAKTLGVSVENESSETIGQAIAKIFGMIKEKHAPQGGWFRLISNLTGITSDKNYTSLLNLMMGTIVAAKQIVFMKVVMGITAVSTAAQAFQFFVQGYLLGAGLTVVMKLCSHSLPEFKRIGIGISTSIIKSLSVISKNLVRLAAITRRDLNNETANMLNDDKNYMNRVQTLANIEDEELQNSFFDKSISNEIIDTIWPTSLTDSTKKAYSSGQLFDDLEKLYKLYASLPTTIQQWRLETTCVNPESSDWDPTNGNVIKVYYQETLVGKIDKVFYQNVLGQQSRWETISKGEAQKLTNIQKQQLNQQNNPKINEFLKAIITLSFLKKLEFLKTLPTAEIFGADQKINVATADTLTKISKLRNELKTKIDLINQSVKILGSKDFNIDSIITGGYHSVNVNDATINFTYAKRYRYKKEDDKPVPYFRQSTALNSGGRVSNLALEIYCFQKMKDTHGLFLNPSNVLHSSLRVVEDAIDTIDIAVTSFTNVTQNLPANAGIKRK